MGPFDFLGPGFVGVNHGGFGLSVIQQPIWKFPLRLGQGQYHGEGIAAFIDEVMYPSVRLSDPTSVVVP